MLLPKYGTNAFGISTLPSGFCPFSSIAAIVLPIASPLALRVWTSLVFLPSLVLIEDLLDWNSSQVLQLDISLNVFEWTQLLGSSEDDSASALTTGLDGSIYVAGDTKGDLDGQISSGYDAFIR